MSGQLFVFCDFGLGSRVLAVALCSAAVGCAAAAVPGLRRRWAES